MSKLKVFITDDWEQLVDTETGEILLEGHKIDIAEGLQICGVEIEVEEDFKYD